MCIYWKDHHTQCQHAETSINSRCARAILTGNNCALPGWQTINRVARLPLCLNCYREAERTICIEYNRQLQRIKNHYFGLIDMRDHPRWDAEDRAEIDRLLVEARNFFNEVRQDRARRLGGFRMSQGVWGDG